MRSTAARRHGERTGTRARVATVVLVAVLAAAAAHAGVASAACRPANAHRIGYAPASTAGTVTVFDTETFETLDTIGGFSLPLDAIQMRDGSKFYVDNTSGYNILRTSISVVDTCSRKIVKTIKVPGPTVSTLNHDETALYGAVVLEPFVERIDTRTDEIVQTYVTPLPAIAAVPTHDDRTLWVGTASTLLFPYDTKTGAPDGAPVSVGLMPAWMLITPDGKRLVTTDLMGDTVSIMDLATRKVTTVHTGVNSGPLYADVTPDGRMLWETNGDGTVKVIDLRTDKIVHTLRPGSFTFGVTFTADGKRAFVPTSPPDAVNLNAAVTTLLFAFGQFHPGPGSIHVYDTSTYQELGVMPTTEVPAVVGLPRSTSYAASGSSAGCADSARPRSAVTRGVLRLRGRGGVRVRGTARDRGCPGSAASSAAQRGGVKSVSVSLTRVDGKRCARVVRAASGALRLGAAQACARFRPAFLRAKGSARWSLTSASSLPSGAYVLRIRATDLAGNDEPMRPSRIIAR